MIVVSTGETSRAIHHWSTSALVSVSADAASSRSLILRVKQRSSLLSTLRCASNVREHRFTMEDAAARDKVVEQLGKIATAL